MKKLIILIGLLLVTTMNFINVQAAAIPQYQIDTSKTGSIEFVKSEVTDSGNSPFEGVEFTVWKIATLNDYYSSAGISLPTVTEAKAMITDTTQHYTAITNKNGYIKFDNLELGLYYVSETSCPPQETKKTVDFIISIPTTNTDGTKWDYNVIVYPKSTTKYIDVTLVKCDSNDTDVVLADAEFTLEQKIIAADENTATWHTLFQLKTDQSGEIKYSKLPVNCKYKLTEVKAPKNYVLDSKPINFTINADGSILIEGNDTPLVNNKIILGNKKAPTKISSDKGNGDKIDSNGSPDQIDANGDSSSISTGDIIFPLSVVVVFLISAAFILLMHRKKTK